jgi:hypothetical protein
MSVPKADTEIPKEISDLIIEIGKKWKKYNKRNLFDKSVVDHWSDLIKQWANYKPLPLIIRNSRGIRGSIIMHSSGREIILCDNSPAKWVAEQVFNKDKPSLSEIKRFLKNDSIPFKFAPISEEKEKATYHCCSKNILNKNGWKLCHIEPVGLGNQKIIQVQDIEFLKRKFILLLDPQNFFIIPKLLGGLGEINIFIESQR